MVVTANQLYVPPGPTYYILETVERKKLTDSCWAVGPVDLDFRVMFTTRFKVGDIGEETGAWRYAYLSRVDGYPPRSESINASQVFTSAQARKIAYLLNDIGARVFYVAGIPQSFNQTGSFVPSSSYPCARVLVPYEDFHIPLSLPTPSSETLMLAAEYLQQIDPNSTGAFVVRDNRHFWGSTEYAPNEIAQFGENRLRELGSPVQYVYTERPKDFVPKIAVAACYVYWKDQVLLLKRLPTSAEGSLWGIPGGKVDRKANEKPEEAAVRELFEETGLDLKDRMESLGEVYVRYPKSDRNGYFDFEYHTFAVYLPDDSLQPQIVLKPEEHTACCWLRLEEAMKELPLIRGEFECFEQRLNALAAPRVEPALRSDVDKIVEVVCAAFWSRDIFVNRKFPRIHREEVEQDFDSSKHLWRVMVTGTDPKIRNIAAAGLYVADSTTTASIHLLSALPQYQRKGFGKLLIEACLKQASEEGKQTVTLQVTNLKPNLISYYEKFGFRLNGVVEEFFQPVLESEWQGVGDDGKPKVTALTMVKSIT